MATGSLRSAFVLWAGQREQEQRGLQAAPLGCWGGSLLACGFSLATQGAGPDPPGWQAAKQGRAEKDTLKDSNQTQTEGWWGNHSKQLSIGLSLKGRSRKREGRGRGRAERPKVADPLLGKPEESLSHVPEHSGTCPKKALSTTTFPGARKAGPRVGMGQSKQNKEQEMRTKNQGPRDWKSISAAKEERISFSYPQGQIPGPPSVACSLHKEADGQA